MKIRGVEYRDDQPLKEVVEDLKKRGQFEEFAEQVKKAGNIQDDEPFDLDKLIKEC